MSEMQHRVQPPAGPGHLRHHEEDCYAAGRVSSAGAGFEGS
jgi:hypothetical protein